jgi:hypothetical protein
MDKIGTWPTSAIMKKEVFLPWHWNCTMPSPSTTPAKPV